MYIFVYVYIQISVYIIWVQQQHIDERESNNHPHIIFKFCVLGDSAKEKEKNDERNCGRAGVWVHLRLSLLQSLELRRAAVCRQNAANILAGRAAPETVPQVHRRGSILLLSLPPLLPLLLLPLLLLCPGRCSQIVRETVSISDLPGSGALGSTSLLFVGVYNNILYVCMYVCYVCYVCNVGSQ